MKIKITLILLSLFYFALCFIPSYQRDLWEPDEPRFVLVAKEMVESGNFVMPHRNGKPYPDKPPFYFWTIVASSKLTGGFNTPSGIMPVAMAGALSIILTFLIALKLGYREEIAFASAIIFASSAKVWWQSTHAQIDMLLAFLIYLSVYLALLYLIDKKEWAITLSFFLMGIATLTKGPVGIIIPLGSIISYLVWTKKWKETKLFSLKTVSAFLFPVGLWLALLILQAISSGNTAYLENILFKQTVVRYAKSWHHFQPVYYYIKVLVHDFFPWSLFLYYFLWRMWKERKESALTDREKFLLSWFLFTVVFFSIPSGKRGLYILPMYPAISIFVASKLYQFKEEKWLKPAIIAISIVVFLISSTIVLYGFDKFNTSWEYFTLSNFAFLFAFAIIFVNRKKREKTLNYIVVPGFLMFYLFATVSTLVFPYLNKRNSMRFFVQEYSKYLDKNSKLAICQYRSAHVLYGNRKVIEFPYQDEEDNIDLFVKFLRETPDSYGIVKKLWVNRLINMGIPVQVLVERKVGHKDLCFIRIEKGGEYR